MIPTCDDVVRSHPRDETSAGSCGKGPIRLASIVGVALLVIAPPHAFAHEGSDAHGVSDTRGAAEAQCPMHSGVGHSADAQSAAASPAPAPAPNRTASSVREYAVPTVRLVRDDGKSVSLPDEMNDGRPVVMNFIFTTCTTICPLMSSVFAQFQRRLGPEVDKVHLMSISIDPERDTPARLVEYAQKFHAGPEWQHYTGTLAASIAVQQAFDVYRGGKMSHSAVTLMRAAPGKSWLRIDGFATADDLVHGYRELLASR